MAQDAGNILVPAGSGVWTAPLDTAATVLGTPPATPWKSVGYTSEDGATLSFGANSEDLMAWESAEAVRTLLQSREGMLQTALMQWDSVTLPLAFGGGEITQETGHAVYSPPMSGDPIVGVALQVDWTDLGYAWRLHIPRATLNEPTESQLSRQGAALLPLNFKILSPGSDEPSWTIMTDHPDIFEAPPAAPAPPPAPAAAKSGTKAGETA